MSKNRSWSNLPDWRWPWTLMLLTVIATSVLLNSATNKPPKTTGKYKLPPAIQKTYDRMEANPPYIAPSSSDAPSAGTGADFVLALILSAGIAALILRRNRPLQPCACLRCHSTGMPRPVYPGSAFFGCLFFCLLIVPWFFYRTWRANNRTFICPVCGSHDIIPLSTPQGQRIAAANRKPDSSLEESKNANEATDSQQNTRFTNTNEPTKTASEPTPHRRRTHQNHHRTHHRQSHENTCHYIT